GIRDLIVTGVQTCALPILIRTNFSAQNARNSIVNPAKLTPWLVDNICMRCHQSGQARVLQPGKDYSDFRPGAALDDTLSIFLVRSEERRVGKECRCGGGRQ